MQTPKLIEWVLKAPHICPVPFLSNREMQKDTWSLSFPIPSSINYSPAHFTSSVGSISHEWPRFPWNASLSWLLWHHSPDFLPTSLIPLSWSPWLAPPPLLNFSLLGLPTTQTLDVFFQSFPSSLLPVLPSCWPFQNIFLTQSSPLSARLTESADYLIPGCLINSSIKPNISRINPRIIPPPFSTPI